ncbi:MAG: preprotein translocase subunit SecG [Candidatus Komeilibacteria bacterium RIFCSPLOWO2_01_FULL_53_11]|uniref:Protein-export membrane protein SecG n=1 Tax=Candidatus Komeilibacteria bacterium RIFCSPLOWO2_01_FULL_53_11 TaxID=1798552 RepID=A0A1G2BSH0_9BACT|nr:MAG: preprotein translocase subunit SecG [Candidatus Komeilibacteria bacterium RIFCSPLOWO2_01_FULL_53_11]
MKNALLVIQIVVSVLLITSILIQQRGSGLGMAFGGANAIYRTKRGAEKIIFRATIVLAILFLLTSIAHLFI